MIIVSLENLAWLGLALTGSVDGIALGDCESSRLGAVDDPSTPESKLFVDVLIGTDDSLSASVVGPKVTITGAIGWFDGAADGIELREWFVVGIAEGVLLLLGLGVGSVWIGERDGNISNIPYR